MDIIIALKTTTRFSRLTGQDRDIYSEKEKYSINFTLIDFQSTNALGQTRTSYVLIKTLKPCIANIL